MRARNGSLSAFITFIMTVFGFVKEKNMDLLFMKSGIIDSNGLFYRNQTGDSPPVFSTKL